MMALKVKAKDCNLTKRKRQKPYDQIKAFADSLLRNEVRRKVKKSGEICRSCLKNSKPKIENFCPAHSLNGVYKSLIRKIEGNSRSKINSSKELKKKTKNFTLSNKFARRNRRRKKRSMTRVGLQVQKVKRRRRRRQKRRAALSKRGGTARTTHQNFARKVIRAHQLERALPPLLPPLLLLLLQARKSRVLLLQQTDGKMIRSGFYRTQCGHMKISPFRNQKGKERRVRVMCQSQSQKEKKGKEEKHRAKNPFEKRKRKRKEEKVLT